MNVNPGIPVMNPAMPAVSNPVPTPPTDRTGGGGTAAPAETARAVGDTRETEPNRPDPTRDRATEARADQSARVREEAAAARARVDAARGQDAAPTGNDLPEQTEPAPATAQEPEEAGDRGQQEPAASAMRERLDARMETPSNSTGNRGGEALDEMA